MKEILWEVKCGHCNTVFKYKNDANEVIEKPKEILNAIETTGICPPCVLIALTKLKKRQDRRKYK